MRAYRKLVDPRYQSEKISAIAYDCGFNDVSYFNRMFRRYFAAAPSDVRGHGRKSFRQIQRWRNDEQLVLQKSIR